MSQTLCQCLTLPHHSAAVGLPREDDTERQGSGVRKRERERVHFSSSTSTLSRGVTSYLCPGAASLDGDGARGSLAWMANGEDLVARSKVLCAHMGERARESAMEGDAERERETDMHPFSHVFDMGVFPTGVKKGRADWAE